MAKATLGYWSRIWQAVAFDTDKGKGRIRILPRKLGPPIHGWAYRYRGKWYSIWRRADGLVFQAMTLRWPITGEFRFSCDLKDNDPKRAFTVLDSEDHVEYHLEYDLPVFDLSKTGDPTWDVIDEEQSDFFLWLSRLSADEAWREGLADSWQPVPEHS